MPLIPTRNTDGTYTVEMRCNIRYSAARLSPSSACVRNPSSSALTGDNSDMKADTTAGGRRPAQSTCQLLKASQSKWALSSASNWCAPERWPLSDKWGCSRGNDSMHPLSSLNKRINTRRMGHSTDITGNAYSDGGGADSVPLWAHVTGSSGHRREESGSLTLTGSALLFVKAGR